MPLKMPSAESFDRIGAETEDLAGMLSYQP